MSTSRRGLFKAAAIAARDAARAAQAEAQARPSLSDAELDRYGRQLLLAEWGEKQQLRLREATVLVIGAGALGSPVASYLAGAGVGRLGIVDGDYVELSNLHRQHLHYTPDIGVAKVHSAVAKLQFINPDVQIEPYQVRFDALNAPGLLEGQDLVVDCSDSFQTRYAVNAACCTAGIPLVEAGVVRTSGIVMSVRPGESACYRCAFPLVPANARTCAEDGVLGPAAGVIGSLQALEAMKLIGGLDGALLNALLQVDLGDYSIVRVAVERRAGCPVCG